MNLPAEPEPSREVRRVINAIHDLSELETQIPLCKTIDEVEEIRLRCQAIQYPAHEHLWDVGASIVAWANRCAVLCELRITELQNIARRRKNGELLPDSNSQPASRISEARLVASLTPEELAKHTETSKSVQLIARKIRKSRKKSEPKGSPEKRAKDLERYYRKKAEKHSDDALSSSPPPKRSPAKKFERYWPQEQKLLEQFFTTSDLPSIEGYWIKAFQSYRKEVEDGKRERQEALAKLKNNCRAQTDISAGKEK